MAIQILPEICISPAPPSENLVEPFSPFDNVHFAIEEDEDNFRPALLSPPPSMFMSIPKHLSPLSPPDAPVKGQGLERERFEQLLKSSRERSAALGNKKSPDLRKELAVKAYQSKQSASSRLITPNLCATLTLCSSLQWNAVRASYSRWRNLPPYPPLMNPRRLQIHRRFLTTPSLRQASFLPWKCTSIWRMNALHQIHGLNRSNSGSLNPLSNRNRSVLFSPSRAARDSLLWTKFPLG